MNKKNLLIKTMKQNDRLHDIKTFYQVITSIEKSIHGKHTFSSWEKNSVFPQRGIYFFFEPGEKRIESGIGDRVVRVGTHALKSGSNTSLWDRLRQHKGYIDGKHPDGGNHRGSVFRKHIGHALINRANYSTRNSENWGIGSNSSNEIRSFEYPIEIEVSKYIRSMPFIWIEIDDPPGPGSLRGYIERNSIALLSNYRKDKIDQSSPEWLGLYSKNSAIINSGLWNVNHVNEKYDSNFLEVFKNLIK